MNRYLDVEKALEAIVYVSNKTHDLFHIVKILYYADKIHLEKYGRLITGDYYVAMNEGPVPSGAYDLIKCARGDDQPFEARIVNGHPEEAIQVMNRDEVIPRRQPSLEYLSESDMECLNQSINLYAEMDISELWRIAHEEDAYKKARKNNTMKLTDIILSLPNGKDVLEYLNS